MPPKAKFTKKEIVDAAYKIVREGGLESLTARELGNRLGSSARPIFTVFNNMEEVQEEVYLHTQKLFYLHTGDYNDYTPSFKRWCMQMVTFAQSKPRLFKLLFLREGVDTPMHPDFISGADNPVLTELLKKDYGLDDVQAKKLFDKLWVFVYGVCVLSSREVCPFSETEIEGMMDEIIQKFVY